MDLRERVLIPLGIVSEGCKKKSCVEIHIKVGLTEAMGWGKCEKKITPKFEDFTDVQLASVLRGCFESDGGVFLRSGKFQHVEFGNTDFCLISFVRKGLFRIGIRSSLYRWKGNKYKTFYHVSVLKKHGNLDLFREKVGFITDRKREILNR